ncbi:hypothetical protein T484DRAFT_1819246 [Baffinella frigidus]|nr:hypothetical protein T484DRAFT_1819246 [Cryptophyta sp. CCMP2293]
MAGKAGWLGGAGRNMVVPMGTQRASSLIASGPSNAGTYTFGSARDAPPPLGLDGVPSRDDRALTPAEVRNRLRELQALCDGEKEALLFVSGVDGKYNDGARKVLNYLLHGCCGSEIYSASRSLEEFDEVVLVVSASDCFLYLGAASLDLSG